MNFDVRVPPSCQHRATREVLPNLVTSYLRKNIRNRSHMGQQALLFPTVSLNKWFGDFELKGFMNHELTLHEFIANICLNWHCVTILWQQHPQHYFFNLFCLDKIIFWSRSPLRLFTKAIQKWTSFLSAWASVPSLAFQTCRTALQQFRLHFLCAPNFMWMLKAQIILQYWALTVCDYELGVIPKDELVSWASSIYIALHNKTETRLPFITIYSRSWTQKLNTYS